jgi:hypothetical protein
MNLFQINIAVSAVLYAGQLLAQEDCSGLKFRSNEQYACEARKRAFFEEKYSRERRDEEARREAEDSKRRQELQLDIQRQQLEIQKRQETEANTARWKLEQEKQTQARQQNSQPTDSDQEANQQMLAMMELMPLLGMSSAARVAELRKAGQCKAARDLMKKEARGGNSSLRIAVELSQGMIAESCDKDLKLAKAHYLRAEKDGSKLAKVLLTKLPEAAVARHDVSVMLAIGEQKGAQEKALRQDAERIEQRKQMVFVRDKIRRKFEGLKELCAAKADPSLRALRLLHKKITETGDAIDTKELDLADDGILNGSNLGNIIYGDEYAVTQVNEPRTEIGYLNIAYKMLTDYGQDRTMVERFRDK